LIIAIARRAHLGRGPASDMLNSSKRFIFLALSVALWGASCRAEPIGQSEGGSAYSKIDTVCPLIEAAARENGLPIDFFVRLIWQESRLRADEIGPVTANGERAQGIAQFMPATAAERDLAEPFDPSKALPKSGAYLAQLRDEFGNLGLAAAAYNAGPQRLRDYLAGAKDLPAETRHYVFKITGHPVEDWAKPGSSNGVVDGAVDASPVTTTCRDVVALLEATPDRLPLNRESAVPQDFRKLQVPGWCSGLRHPNATKCGTVHLRDPLIKKGLRPTAVSRVHLPRSHVHFENWLSHRPSVVRASFAPKVPSPNR